MAPHRMGGAWGPMDSILLDLDQSARETGNVFRCVSNNVIQGGKVFFLSPGRSPEKLISRNRIWALEKEALALPRSREICLLSREGLECPLLLIPKERMTFCRGCPVLQNMGGMCQESPWVAIYLYSVILNQW